MNARIRELIKVATDHALDVVSGLGVAKNTSTLYADAFQEKLAELVAAECADIVDNSGRFIKYDALAIKIRQRFGVKL